MLKPNLSQTITEVTVRPTYDLYERTGNVDSLEECNGSCGMTRGCQRSLGVTVVSVGVEMQTPS